MKHNLPYILNLPPFTYRGINFNSKSLLFKVFFIIRGKLIGFIINNSEKMIFCNLINIFYPKKSKIYYKDTFYMKDIENVGTITYPNKRILRIVHHEDLLKRIINNLPNWEKNRTGRLANKITDSRKGISKLIDSVFPLS